MSKNRFSEEQIIYVLKWADSGKAVTEINRQMGMSKQAFYQWRSKYRVIVMKRLRQLEKENHRLKQQVTDLVLEKHALLERLSKAIIPVGENSAIRVLRDQAVKRQETKREHVFIHPH